MNKSLKSLLFFLTGTGTIITIMIVGTGFISPIWIVPGIVLSTLTHY